MWHHQQQHHTLLIKEASAGPLESGAKSGDQEQCPNQWAIMSVWPCKCSRKSVHGGLWGHGREISLRQDFEVNVTPIGVFASKR